MDPVTRVIVMCLMVRKYAINFFILHQQIKTSRLSSQSFLCSSFTQESRRSFGDLSIQSSGDLSVRGRTASTEQLSGRLFQIPLAFHHLYSFSIFLLFYTVQFSVVDVLRVIIYQFFFLSFFQGGLVFKQLLLCFISGFSPFKSILTVCEKLAKSMDFMSRKRSRNKASQHLFHCLSVCSVVYY